MAYRPIFFDTETTGVFPEKDRIIEIAAFDPVRGKTFEKLVHPGMPIPKEATFIHQISDEMVKDADPFQIVGKEFLEFCEGEVALVAHNLFAFDLPFLRRECQNATLQIPETMLFI